jgi:hypothetical protein
MFVSNSKSYYYHEYAHSFETIEDRAVSGWNGKWVGAMRPTFIKKELDLITN